jgi:hypothetical protein
MRRQQAKGREAWRCRREQYLRESGRHVELIKEGYASAECTTNWTVVIGGRPSERNAGMRLFLVKEGDLLLEPGAKKAASRQPGWRGRRAAGEVGNEDGPSNYRRSRWMDKC